MIDVPAKKTLNPGYGFERNVFLRATGQVEVLSEGIVFVLFLLVEGLETEVRKNATRLYCKLCRRSQAYWR